MPVQSFRKLPMPGRQVVTSPEGILERRLLLVLCTLAIGLLAATEMGRPLAENGTSLLDAGLFLLFFSLFCWIAFGFFNAVAGFFVLLMQRGMVESGAVNPPMPRKRTAVLIPVYNEDVGPLFARIRKMTAMVAETGAADMFDFFVLSDSSPQAEIAEYSAYLCAKRDSTPQLFYRRRPINTARKPGNIAEWVTRFGGAYEYMIVLDADSLMTGRAMIRLASMMDRSPGTGLIQTIPSVINGRTLFARWQQFAAAAYGPIASAGQIWWSGAEATFWGHNAILRVRAFADSCGLPELTGPEPFGGHVMSHDMVEAALMRRRGWAGHMISLGEGSHEEFPPTLSDFAVRDRRWCQGNLQHLRLLNGAGFHWVSRLQLLMGASAYLTAPLWAMLTMTTLLYMLGLTDPPGFSGWPLLLTAILLFLPKILSLALLIIDRERCERLGGARRVIASMMFELPLSMLVAPLNMISQTLSIIDILRGKASGWSPQRRDADGIPFRDAIRDYRWHMVVGFAMFFALISGVNGTMWLIPIMAGLIVAPVIATLTSCGDIGDRLSRMGIFPSLDIEESKPSARASDQTDFGIRLVSGGSGAAPQQTHQMSPRQQKA